MTRPRLLDLFCCAGGAGMGYQRAGFEVVGVDIKPQPRYPFEFHQADALDYLAAHGHEFDAIHASPPCQRFSTMTKRWGREQSHPDLIGATRALIHQTSKPYIIENVEGARNLLVSPVLLCGSMFGLPLRRHRYFELSHPALMTPGCNHSGKIVGVYGHSGGSSRRDGLTFGGVQTWKDAMQIDWMIGAELAEAIPPAYTEFIGRHILEQISIGAHA